MKPLSIYNTVIAFPILAACTSDPADTNTDLAFSQDGPLTVAELNAVGSTLATFATDVSSDAVRGQTPTELANLGSASFDGYLMGQGQTQDTVIVGRADLTATFTGGGAVNGSVSDMVMIDGALIDVGGTTTVDDIESFTYTAMADTTVLSPIDGALTLSGGAIGVVDSRADITIDVLGTATIPAALSETANEEIYDVDGTLNAGVGTDNSLVGVGELMAESSDHGFDLDAILFAR